MPPSAHFVPPPLPGNTFCIGITNEQSYFDGLNEKLVASHYHYNRDLHVWRANCCAEQVQQPAHRNKKAICEICVWCHHNLRRRKSEQLMKSYAVIAEDISSVVLEIDQQLLIQTIKGDKHAAAELDGHIRFLKLKQIPLPKLICVVEGICYFLLPCSQVPVSKIVINNGMHKYTPVKLAPKTNSIQNNPVYFCCV
jgi:hypothetical protein